MILQTATYPNSDLPKRRPVLRPQGDVFNPVSFGRIITATRFHRGPKVATAFDKILVQTPSVCGGRIRIDGTRITVHRLVVLYKQGASPEEIARSYTHLSLGQIYMALAYYHANRDQIEAQLAEDDAEYERLKQQAGPAE